MIFKGIKVIGTQSNMTYHTSSMVDFLAAEMKRSLSPHAHGGRPSKHHRRTPPRRTPPRGNPPRRTPPRRTPPQGNPSWGQGQPPVAPYAQSFDHQRRLRYLEGRLFSLQQFVHKQTQEHEQHLIQVRKETTQRVQNQCKGVYQEQHLELQKQQTIIRRYQEMEISQKSVQCDITEDIADIDFGDKLFLVQMNDAQKKAFRPCKIMDNQFMKKIETGKNPIYKFVYVYLKKKSRQEQGQKMIYIHDIPETFRLRNTAQFLTMCKNGIRRKNAVQTIQKQENLFRKKCQESNIRNSCMQNAWNKESYFRWPQAWGRKGDLRAKMSSDFLSSCQFYDEELSPELVEMLSTYRGELYRDGGKICFYCGVPATEDDHYMSRVRDGAINKYLDCEINVVPSCSGCNRFAGKDNQGSLENPLDWWLDGDGSLREKYEQHPQNKIIELDELVQYSMERKIRLFASFHDKFAPKLDDIYHRQCIDGIETVLSNTWAYLLNQLDEFDKEDAQRFNSGLIAVVNKKFTDFSKSDDDKPQKK